MGRLLIVEDSPSTCMTYRNALGSDHELAFAGTRAEAIALGGTQTFDLMLIDVILPDGDGFELCRQLAQCLGSLLPPFLFVSGRYSLQDKLAGFAMGAEDYITKPFEPEELQARVQIRLRRQSGADALSLRAKDYGLTIDAQSLRALIAINGQPHDLHLTPNEFRLLCVLLSNAGRVMTRSELLEAGWGLGVHVLERTVDRHVSSLRRKLNRTMDYLEAVPGSGYRWVKLPARSE